MRNNTLKILNIFNISNQKCLYLFQICFMFFDTISIKIKFRWYKIHFSYFKAHNSIVFSMFTLLYEYYHSLNPEYFITTKRYVTHLNSLFLPLFTIPKLFSVSKDLSMLDIYKIQLCYVMWPFVSDLFYLL